MRTEQDVIRPAREALDAWATMTSWQYGTTLYQTRTAMLRGMVGDYVTAQGMNNPADILAEYDDATLADEIIGAGWLACACDPEDLGERGGEHRPGCMAGYGVGRDDVLETLGEYRAEALAEAVEVEGREEPDTCLGPDGHWYVVTYGRARWQIHAPDCEKCQEERDAGSR